MTNIAMENGPFIDEFTINTSIYKGFSMAMLVITRWYLMVVEDDFHIVFILGIFPRGACDFAVDVERWLSICHRK